MSSIRIGRFPSAAFATFTTLAAIALAAPSDAVAQDADTRAMMARAVDQLAEPLRGQGFEQIGALYHGALDATATEEFRVGLRAGTEYAIVAICDNDCTDVDLRVYDASVAEVDSDLEVDAVPVVQFTADDTGQYTVSVAMVACSVEPCYHAVAVYERITAVAVSSGDARSVLNESGSLGSSDESLTGGEYFDRYTIDLQVGQRLIVDMTSNDFDTYLAVLSPSDDQNDNDDHEGDASRSHVEFDVTEPGSYRVLATSFEAGETGAYRIEARVEGAGVTENRVAGGARVEAGRLENGDTELDGGEYMDSYRFSVEAGQEIMLDLRSGDLDPYLILQTPGGEQEDNDDFEGDASRSVIAITATESGEYVAGVTSYGAGESGAYRLEIDVGEGRTANTGVRTESGTLSADDETLETGEFVDVYTIQGSPGSELTATLRSNDFDTYLIVRGPNEDRGENDDLEGRPGESEVALRLTESGEYRVIVTSYAAGETGAYELALNQGVAERADQQDRDVQTLVLGDGRAGRLAASDTQLENGEYRDMYVFDGRAGQAVSISLESQTFDTYLALVPPGGDQVDNDDWEGDTNLSRIDHVLGETGRYRVLATSYGPGETGGYRISLEGGDASAIRAADTNTRGDGAPSNVYGVFVGVSDYGGRANDLAYTADDARRVSAALQEGAGMSASNSVVLTDAQATRANIVQAVRDVGSRAGPDDMFVFFYSGHGSRVPRDGPQMSDPDALDETLEFYDAAITDDEFSDLLSEISPGISMLILDACFSGGFSKDVVSVPGRMGFFSSEEDVTSQVAAKFRAGGYLALFVADAVKDGLADADGDQATSAIELSQYLYERYRADVKSGDPSDYVRTGGPQSGYQHLVVDRGSIGPSQILFRN